MIFSDKHHGRGMTERATSLLCSQREEELVAGFFIAVPPGNEAGYLIGAQAQITVVLTNRFLSVSLVISADSGIETRLAE